MYTKLEDAHEGELPAELSLVNVDQENVIIEVVKKAEDSEAIIIRLYECYNMRTKVNCQFFHELQRVAECDLMENEIEEINSQGNHFAFDIKPYEIKTFKLKLK
ncbi:MAG TPA: glycosyl hydrolase-related protein [Mobilitalea sp.]|nr:glycosyl hydrolase-related protein [Mobilitalea sp.]